MNLLRWSALLCTLTLVGQLSAQDREAKVRNDKKLLEASETWIYNDLPKAFREAAKSKKPVLLVFRCIPCEACHEFDEQVVEREPQIRELLDQFVCVRVPQANGLDLSQYQFDYDMSFAVMYLHHDGKSILGRFGTRTGRDNEKDDMHLLGFADSMKKSLALHRDFDANRSALAAKLGAPSAFKTPEDMPMLKGKYTDKLDYEGKVVQSCIHCHQVREAQRMVYRAKGEPIPDQLLFPWPGLSVIGLKMDPQTATTVAAVAPGSIAEKSGLKAGDELQTLSGQPLVSVADVQWVLHQAGDQAQFAARVQRSGKPVNLTIVLPAGWRKAVDIGWRATSWDLRRMAFGGMLLVSLTSEERQAAGLAADKFALRIKHVGQYGEHARAKQAGLQVGDLVVGYDGSASFQTESELLAHAMQQKKPGDSVKFDVLRNGKPMAFTVKLQ